MVQDQLAAERAESTGSTCARAARRPTPRRTGRRWRRSAGPTGAAQRRAAMSEPHDRATTMRRRDHRPDETWDLCLYVTGRSPKCLRAIENLRRACEEHLAGRYRIEVVDLLENPRRPPTTRSWPCPRWSGGSRRRSVSSSATSPTPTVSSSGCSFERERARRCDRYRCGPWLLVAPRSASTARAAFDPAIETVRRISAGRCGRGGVPGSGAVSGSRGDPGMAGRTHRWLSGRCGVLSAAGAGRDPWALPG